MFIAMNRFRIVKGKEAEFERIWAERDSHLDGVPGFEGFNLLRGAEADDHTLYASHSVWRASAISRTGPNPKPSARPTPAREAPRTSIRVRPASKASRACCELCGSARPDPDCMTRTVRASGCGLASQ